MFSNGQAAELGRIAAYTRVSTQEQAEEGVSLETQRARVEQWAHDRDLHQIEFYTDAGYSGALGYNSSGKQKHRPELARLVADVEAGRIDAIVVYRLDRIFRSPAICVRFLDDVVLAHDVPLISVVEGLDSSQPYGRMIMQLLSIVSGYYLDWLRENVSDNLRKRMEDGHPMGIASFGWRYERTEEGQPRRLVRVPDQGRWLLLMKEMFLSGHSVASIGRRLHENAIRTPRGGEHWTQSVIARLLRNPKHAGYLVVGDGHLVRATHYEDRYWELDDYHRIEELFEARIAMGGTTAAKPTYLLSGLITCAHCGQRLCGHRHRGGIYRRYRCSPPPGRRTPHCSANSKPAEVLEGYVISMLRELSQSDEIQRLAHDQAEALVDQEDGQLRERLESLDRQLAKATSDIERWNDRMIDDPEMDRRQFHHHSRVLNDRKQRLEARRREAERRLERSRSRMQRLAQVQELLRDFDALWEVMDPEERRHAIHMVVHTATLEHHEDGSATLAVTPHFSAARSFTIPHLHAPVPIGEGRSLTLRQLAFLKLYREGLTRQEIARRWDVQPGVVNGVVGEIRRRCGVDLDAAAKLAAQAIGEYEQVLVVAGRAQRRRATRADTALTDSQIKVLALVLEGHTAPKIAELLGIGSVNTVYVHVHNARQSLGAPTSRAAAERARALGLLGPRDMDKPASLSRRELALLKHVQDGRSLAQIAKRWDTSEENVRHTAARISGKLGEEDLAAAAEIVRDQIDAAGPSLPLEGRMRGRPERDGKVRLTAQEQQVLSAYAEGLSYQQIAGRDVGEVSTVTNCLRRVRKLLGASTSEAAVAEARRRGLL